MKGLEETFTYDALNPLTSATVQVSGTAFAQEFRYDANTNLVYKSDVGDFNFSSDHPHAVKEVRDPKNSSQLMYEFEYDANGNRVSGNGTAIVYN